MLETTLIYLRKDNKILLGKKLRGFGIGKITGIGGKFEEDESALECAIRESFEESGVRLTKLEEVGRVIYDNLVRNGIAERNLMHVFVATEWQGEPSSSEEMELEWFAIRDIPYEKMWSDAKEYLPALLRGEHFEAYFLYDEKYRYNKFWIKPISDTILAEPTDSSYGLSDQKFDPTKARTRYGARAVLLDNKGRVCLCHGKNRNYFKLPGGGRNTGELAYENLEREVREEVGYTIRNIIPLGRVIEHRAKQEKNVDCYGFLCYVNDFIGSRLEEDEIEDGMEAYWAENLDEALGIIEAENSDSIDKRYSYQINFWKTRESAFLRAAKRYLNHKTEATATQNGSVDEDFGTESEE